MVTIAEEIKELSRELSPYQRRLLEFVESTPESMADVDLNTLEFPGERIVYPYRIQPWPTFLSGKRLAEVRTAPVEISRLIRSIPARVFDNDPERIQEYYGGFGLASLAVMLRGITGVDSILSRSDLIWTSEGFKCLELNMSASIGGWQVRFWVQNHRSRPWLARFISECGGRISYRDPLRALTHYIIRDNRERWTEGELNLAHVGSVTAGYSNLSTWFDSDYQLFLKEEQPSLNGSMDFGPASTLEVRDSFVYRKGRRVHALIDYEGDCLEGDVLRCYKMGKLGAYNGPIYRILNDKRNLALLSELVDSGLFSPEERDAIHQYIPWTRRVVPGFTYYQGERIELAKLLKLRRNGIVLKMARSAQGADVHVGKATPTEVWEDLIQTAMATGTWVAQEYLESVPYLYQDGSGGCCLHDVVWGLFSFGEEYGGGFLRMLPVGKEVVINSARGASEGILYEVEEGELVA